MRGDLALGDLGRGDRDLVGLEIETQIIKNNNNTHTQNNNNNNN